MGWVWKDDEASDNSSSRDVSDFTGSNSNPASGDRCATRKVVKSQCRTEQTEPDQVKWCNPTKSTLEEDVTDEIAEGSFSLESADRGTFNFPGLRNDSEAIERHFFGGFDRFFGAAEEMKNGCFGVFGTPRGYDDFLSRANRRGVPIEGYPPKSVHPKLSKSDGEVDLSGLSRDV